MQHELVIHNYYSKSVTAKQESAKQAENVMLNRTNLEGQKKLLNSNGKLKIKTRIIRTGWKYNNAEASGQKKLQKFSKTDGKRP